MAAQGDDANGTMVVAVGEVHGGGAPDADVVLEPQIAARLEAIRRMREMSATPIPESASDAEMARRLAWDTLASLARSELATDMALSALELHTRALAEQNRLKAIDIGLQRDEADRIARIDAQDAKHAQEARSVVLRGVNGAMTMAGLVLLDSRTITAVVSVVTTIVGGGVVAWLSGLLSF